jgi:hypothetical protein
VAEQRSRFFERLALVSGGSVVLSVTLLTTILGKTPIHAAAILLMGWFSFIVALISALFRDLPYQRYTLVTYMKNYLEELQLKKQDLLRHRQAGVRVLSEPQEDGSFRNVSAEELQAEIEDLRVHIKERASEATGAERRFRALERVSKVAFCAGVLLLAGFAAVNVLAASHLYLR